MIKSGSHNTLNIINEHLLFFYLKTHYKIKKRLYKGLFFKIYFIKRALEKMPQIPVLRFSSVLLERGHYFYLLHNDVL